MIRLKQLLAEQKSDQLMPGQSDNPQFTGKVKARQTSSDLMKGADAAAKANNIGHHNALMLASVAAGFVPIIGVFLSSGIMLVDAKIYEKEGNTYQAGLAKVFAALPLIGPVARLGSGAIAKLGSWGMSKLGFKVATAAKGGSAPLTKLEAQAVQDLTQNNKFVRAELDKYLTATAKQNSKKLSAWGMRKTALSMATKEALKNPLTKAAATLGLYMGAADIYDYVYWQRYSVKPEQAKAMIDQTQQEILDESIRSLDRMIAEKKRGRQVAQSESVNANKSTLNEVDVSVAKEILPQFLNIYNIIGVVALVGGRWGANALLSYAAKRAAEVGWTTFSSKLSGFRIPGFVKITELLYRGIKGLFVGQKAAFKGYRLFAVNQKDLALILSKLKEAQLAEYNKVLGYVRDGQMTADRAMARFSRDANLKQFESVKDELYTKLEDLAIEAKKAKEAAKLVKKSSKKTKKKTTAPNTQSANTPPPNTGGQQSTAQKDVNKYYVPKNMSIDDYDKLDFNTQAYIQNNDLDWTYDEAKRWQNR
jgi:DNA-binding transcriptional MerR regulator